MFRFLKRARVLSRCTSAMNFQAREYTRRKVREAARAAMHAVARMNRLRTMTPMQSMTMAVVTMTFQVARMRRPATTIQAPRRTTVLASKMTSAEFAAVTASLKAHAIAMETYWTNAENAAAMALRTAHAIAMEMYWTSAEFAAVTASPMAHAIAMEAYWMPWVNVEDPVLPTSMRMAFP